MVNRARPTQSKRERERAKAEKQKEKAARRAETKARRAGATPRRPGEDPDIAGIVPGPQASPWEEMYGIEPQADSEDDREDA
jgi:hypothetical protein